MNKITIGIDQYCSISSLGGVPFVFVECFVENTDAGQSQEYTFSKLLDEMIESDSIPGGTMRPEHKTETIGTLQSMINILEQKIEAVNVIPLWAPQDND
jgi:hypothetical protein